MGQVVRLDLFRPPFFIAGFLSRAHLESHIGSGTLLGEGAVEGCVSQGIQNRKQLMLHALQSLVCPRKTCELTMFWIKEPKSERKAASEGLRLCKNLGFWLPIGAGHLCVGQLVCGCLHQGLGKAPGQ